MSGSLHQRMIEWVFIWQWSRRRCYHHTVGRGYTHTNATVLYVTHCTNEGLCQALEKLSSEQTIETGGQEFCNLEV